MGRRYRKEREGGLIEELGEVLLLCSKRWPAIGLVIGGTFCATGAYLAWGNPKLLFGLAPVFGLLSGVFGLICLGIGAFGLLKNRIAARQAVARLNRRWILADISAMNWQQFEMLVADLFRRMGYVVVEHGRSAQAAGRGDGGVDLLLTDPRAAGIQFLVQCKQYKTWDVGEPKIREFYGAMAAWRTRCEGIIVTCGQFTGPARAFATGKPIRLIDGAGLLKMLNQSNPLTPVVRTHIPATMPEAAAVPAVSPIAGEGQPAPTCPRCQRQMVRRVAGRGSRAGQPFWGCSNYPACKVCIDIPTSAPT